MKQKKGSPLNAKCFKNIKNNSQVNTKMQIWMICRNIHKDNEV